MYITLKLLYYSLSSLQTNIYVYLLCVQLLRDIGHWTGLVCHLFTNQGWNNNSLFLPIIINNSSVNECWVAYGRKSSLFRQRYWLGLVLEPIYFGNMVYVCLWSMVIDWIVAYYFFVGGFEVSPSVEASPGVARDRGNQVFKDHILSYLGWCNFEPIYILSIILYL